MSEDFLAGKFEFWSFVLVSNCVFRYSNLPPRFFFLSLHHPGGHLYGFFHGTGAGGSLAGDIIGDPVIHGSTDKRQPQGDIHRRVEMEKLQGDQTLVVVHADYGVVFSLHRAVKEESAGQAGGTPAPFPARSTAREMIFSSFPKSPPSRRGD
jgi:hypothetical protein